MMKYMRRHTKRIMVVIVLFAMFSFVGGSALQRILSPQEGSAKVGTAWGAEVTTGDVRAYQIDLELLPYLGSTSDGRPYLDPTFGQGREFGLDHFYLLVREAARAGIQPSDSDIEALMRNLGITAESLSRQRNRALFNVPTVKAALARYLSVLSNASRVLVTAAPTEAQAKRYAADTEAKINVKFVPLDAQFFVDHAAPVSEQEIAEQFERYKDVEAGQGEYGFGYRKPRRVNVEILAAKPGTIATQVEVSEEEVKAHWRINHASYKKPQHGPTTNPAEPPPLVEKTFQEAYENVERDLRTKKALQKAQQALRKAAEELQKPWLDAKTDPETGFKPIPAAVRDPAYLLAVKDKYEREFGIQLQFQKLGPIPEAELAKTPGIAQASTQGQANEQLTLAEYAFRVPPFFHREADKETELALQWFQTPDAPLISQMQFYGMTMEGMTDRQDFYLFRVTEAFEAETPASYAEFRAMVERDVRRLRSFKQLEATANEVMRRARRVGLAAALTTLDDVISRTGVRDPIAPPPFARRTAPQMFMPDDGSELKAPNILGLNAASEEFVDACFTMSEPDWTAPPALATTQPDPTTTQPAVMPEPRVTIVAMPKLMKWAVIEFVRYDGVTQDKYDKELRIRSHQTLRSRRQSEISKAWFNPSNIEKRCQFVRAKADREAAPRSGVERQERPNDVPAF